MKSVITILLIVCCLSSCKIKNTSETEVVATTGWTAAYALAAGATNVSVLAPYEMVHPSEYELRPGDIGRLGKARLIIYAGYEVMVDQIKTGLEIPEEKLLKITTSYNVEEIEKAVMLIANKLGTEQTAIKNIEEIKMLMDNGRFKVHETGRDSRPALVHFFQESFASELGIKAVGIFGPGTPEPKQILIMTKTKAELIIDNAHNPVGGPVKEILNTADYILLLNFPGMYQTRTIADVLRYNVDQLSSLATESK